MENPSDGRPAVVDKMARAVPHWLVAAAQPTRVPVPWGQMLRSVLAIWVPLAAGIVSGDHSAAVLPALGGLITVMLDQGGTYSARFRLMGTATVCGGAVGLVIGTLIHGHGWVAVVVVTAVASASAIISRLGRIGSATALQLLLLCTICLGPTGTLLPWWHPAVGFLAGAAWALLLLVPGWLVAPHAAEVRLVAAVYHNVANALRATGTPELAPVRQAMTASINAAYDALPARSAAGQRTRPDTHLLAILDSSHQVTEAATTLRVAGERPPPWVTDTIDRLADIIGTRPTGQRLPVIPPQWSGSPGALALRESIVRLSRAISGDWTPSQAPARPSLSGQLRNRLRGLKERLTGGWLAWTFNIRLTSCMLVASVLSEVLPLQRSYWVPLAVAVILKPDYGSVFIRAVQRAGGTIVGALLGAVVLAVVPFGPWLLLPFGILAALFPYGKAMNFGLSASFLAPFVVLLIDFVTRAGWGLATSRAIDTVVASAVVLLVGYAPWPVSWHAHLPGKFAATLRQICDYMDESLITAWADGGQQAGSQPAAGQGSPGQQPTSAQRRARLRRQCYRALSDLRVEYQRTISEPSAISRRATLLWPAVTALEALLDAAAATAVAISGGAPAPDPSAVRQLTGELRAIAGAITAGLSLPPTSRPTPADETLEPVTTAVRSVLSVLTPIEHLPDELAAESATAHHDLGDILWEAKRYPEAEAAFRAAIHLNPGHSLARDKLAELLQREAKQRRPSQGARLSAAASRGGREEPVRSPNDSRLAATQWMARVLPDWLVDAVRPQKVPIPWATMLRSVIAIWAPLAAGIISGDRTLALLPTLGGVMSIMADQNGPYPARFRRVGTAACGGAVGLAIGISIHGRGWAAVLGLAVVAALSTIVSRLGSTGSVTGLQLLLYCTLCLGPLGALHPWWHPAVGFVAGAVWALLLLVPGWLRAPQAAEAELVATVYHNVASDLRATGTPDYPARRQALTTSLNAAYDALPTRLAARRRMRQGTHLLAILTSSHAVTEAATALRIAGERTPPWVTDAIDRLADAIAVGPAWEQLPAIPLRWSNSPGALALRESLVRLSRTISGEGTLTQAATDQPALRERLGRRLRYLLDEVIGGWLAWTFTIRLTSCILAASVLSEVLPLQRSYWVPLTVAVILKPDYGSVFIRAVQRAIGTIVGAVIGAAILAVVPFGPWLLVPFGILAALLPWGKAANFGLSATFLAPFVVLLIDLLKQAGWSLAADRAIDTVVASAVVLLVGYTPWPVSWHAHLPGQFAATLRQICDYMDESLASSWTAGGRPAGAQPAPTPSRSWLPCQCSRTLSDLHIEYQRAMTEPPAISRRASLLWPAVVALEGLLDAVDGTAMAICQGAPAPDPAAVHQLTNELRAVAGAITAGLSLPPSSRPLPSDQTLEPVTSAVRSVLSILTPVEQLPH